MHDTEQSPDTHADDAPQVDSSHFGFTGMTPPKPPLFFRVCLGFSTPPPLTARQWKVLTLVGVMTIFSRYDSILFTLVLTQIYGTFGFPTDDYEDGIIAFVSLGSVLTLGFMCFADIWGRRSVLLGCLVAFSVCTCLAGLAPNLWTLLGMQFLARCFANSLISLTPVVIVEEIGEQDRGWAVGALVVMGSLGPGIALMLFSAVNFWPQGWRLLYLMGGLPLALFWWVRRSLPESRRFLLLSSVEPTCQGACRGISQRWWSLFTDYPMRVLGILLISFLVPFNDAGAGALGPTYFQTALHFSPPMYSVLTLSSSFVTTSSSAIFGRLSDRIGRRPVTGIGIIGGAIGVSVLYVAPNVYIVVPAYLLMSLSGVITKVMFTALSAELFPTLYRSTAAGLIFAVWILAIPLGIGFHNIVRSQLTSHFGNNPDFKWTAVSLCASLNLFVPLLLVLLPAPDVLAAMEVGMSGGNMSSETPAVGETDAVPVPWVAIPDIPDNPRPPQASVA